MLFVDPHRSFTVIIKNKPYEIKKAVRMQNTICIDFNMFGSNDDTLLARCVTFVTLIFAIPVAILF